MIRVRRRGQRISADERELPQQKCLEKSSPCSWGNAATRVSSSTLASHACVFGQGALTWPTFVVVHVHTC